MSVTRQSGIDNLAPAFREKLEALLADLKAENIPLRVFETVRSPYRQAQLYAKGRTAPGPTVTKAQPFESAHQYGMAADLVFYVDGKWTWTEPRKGLWKRFGELAAKRGLEQLSFEMPHVQLPTWRKVTSDRSRWPAYALEQWALWNGDRAA